MRTIRVLKPIEQYAPQVRTEIPKTNFLFGLMTYGRLISVSQEVNNSTATLYTVPSGKEFFLIHGHLAVVNGSAGAYNSTSFLFATISSSFFHELLRLAPGAVGNSISSVYSPHIPVKLLAGQQIRTQSTGASIFISAQITGYEIDASLVPNFQ